MSNEERFHDIAHQVFAGTAPPADAETFREMLAKEPHLGQEYSAIAAGSTAARELAPLMGAPPVPPGGIPPPPVQRLREEVRAAFAGRQRAKNELGQLMGKLEAQILGLASEERDLAGAALSLLRRSFLAALPDTGTSRASRMFARSQDVVFGLTGDDEPFPLPDLLQEQSRGLAELRLHLVDLHERLKAADRNRDHLREQIRGVLAAIERHKKANPGH